MLFLSLSQGNQASHTNPAINSEALSPFRSVKDSPEPQARRSVAKGWKIHPKRRPVGGWLTMLSQLVGTYTFRPNFRASNLNMFQASCEHVFSKKAPDMQAFFLPRLNHLLASVFRLSLIMFRASKHYFRIFKYHVGGSNFSFHAPSRETVYSCCSNRSSACSISCS